MSKADAIGFIVLCSACEDSVGAVSVFPQAVRSARTAFRRIAFSCFANQAAGDFCACVSGRLRPEIIGIAVDHHGSPDDFLHTKTICPDSQICTAAAGDLPHDLDERFPPDYSGRLYPQKPGRSSFLLHGCEGQRNRSCCPAEVLRGRPQLKRFRAPGKTVFARTGTLRRLLL